MNNLKIKHITDSDDKSLQQVEQLFVDMYEFIKDKGLKLQLVEGGEKLWINSVKKSMDRFAALIVAIENDRVVGFIHGVIRFAPDFLGGSKVGFVTHQHIVPECRGKGLGKKMMFALEDWFKSKNIKSVELQANYFNEYSRKYLEKCGYEYELVQFRKFI